MAAAYRKGLPEKVQQILPEAAVLDVDSTSGELVLHYALRLLRESEKAVVYIKADATVTGFGGILPLLEELFDGNEQRLILLSGDYPRLLRMLQARPQVQFAQVNEQDALEAVKQFLEE
ncbi:hypothetical protein MKJ04_11600 [Pontibacter sp. E15-1]|uniref:hypothetical protein n=1 Tax=Pontibacter sp. E15-1 TaxID=2919918 RepID=UPI001F4FE692|nr:hypothetical protein [Pontibacter sp. E15-1]MCJ8165488.1 hypothetical protein [Pontibacter sp. E15-1]